MFTNREKRVKGLLLDVGGTIAFPKSGSWFIPNGYSKAFIENGVEPPSFEEFYNSIPVGMEYLDKHYEAENIEEEYELFSKYYWHVLKKLLTNDPPTALCEKLSKLRVYENDNFEFYSDVLPVIKRLSNNGIALGIISENWPSLLTDLKKQDCIELFTSITISSIVKCKKSNRHIFDIAIKEIRVEPESILFIDDGFTNVEAAVKIGMHGLQMRRKTTWPTGECRTVENMEGVDQYIEEVEKKWENEKAKT